MAEYTLVQPTKTIQYKGYLHFRELWSHLRVIIERNGYDYLEKDHNEIVHENGKDIHIHFDSDRRMSDYVKIRMRLVCTVKDLKNVTTILDEKEVQTQEADFTLTAEAYVVSDFEGRWQNKATLFFLRVIGEKFFLQREMKKFDQLAKKDVANVLNETKKYLNLETP